jgi:hypothetical protein
MERGILWARVFFWLRDLPCKSRAAFYRQVERGYVPSPGPYDPPCKTWELLVRCPWSSLFYPWRVYRKIFLMSYLFVMSPWWDPPGCRPGDKHLGSLDIYFITTPLCFMMLKTGILSLYYHKPSWVVITHDPCLIGWAQLPHGLNVMLILG